MLVIKNTIVVGCLHQVLDSAGVFMPMRANRMFDIPTGSESEQNHDSEAHAYAAINEGSVMLLPVRIMNRE